MKKSKLVGKVAHITNRDSIYFNEWGTITAYDGDVYYLAILNDMNRQAIFDRDEFKISRKRKGHGMMKYKPGDILRGQVNGAEIEILKANDNGNYVYVDMKTGRRFTTDYKTLERCAIEKIN